jgi:hypothetical protein
VIEDAHPPSRRARMAHCLIRGDCAGRAPGGLAIRRRSADRLTHLGDADVYQKSECLNSACDCRGTRLRRSGNQRAGDQFVSYPVDVRILAENGNIGQHRKSASGGVRIAPGGLCQDKFCGLCRRNNAAVPTARNSCE